MIGPLSPVFRTAVVCATLDPQGWGPIKKERAMSEDAGTTQQGGGADEQQQQQPGAAGQSGLAPNVAALLSYLLGFITGIIFLVIEKEDRFVRFHAMQSTLTFGGLFVINVLTFIPVLGWMIQLLLWPVSVILWILLMVKAYQKENFKLPIVGDLAESNI
jgi:uncharacterized membrane protein